MDFLLLLRLKHWIKNLLIFSPLLFSFSFSSEAAGRSTLTFLAFCLLASAVYTINDILDADRDRHHPLKKGRPIASGAVSASIAKVTIGLLLVGSISFTLLVDYKILYILGLYLFLNLGYSFGLKNIPVLDVLIIAFGFVIRIFAGAAAIGVAVSHWILLTTFFLSLFLAFGKRKNEMSVLGKGIGRNRHRQSIAEYTEGFIDQMLALTAGISVVFYALYTIDQSTVERFRGDNLIYSTPIVVFGIFRYFFLLYNRNQGGDPINLIARDRQLIGSVIVWLIFVLLVYLGPLNEIHL